MRAKRRTMHGKRLKRSELRKNYDFSKKADYSSEATKDTIGAKFAKAITPENTVKGVLGTLAPIGKVGKIAKTAYNYFKS